MSSRALPRLPLLQFVLANGAADGHVVHREMSADFRRRVGSGLVGQGHGEISLGVAQRVLIERQR